MEEQKKIGLSKLAAGIILIVGGLLGLIFGKNAKQAFIRIPIFIFSVGAIASGVYLFVDGVDDLAIGRVGDYQLGMEYIQPFFYQDPQAFKSGMADTFKHFPQTRRLHFRCPDSSKAFTVYNTKFWIIGVPGKGIDCDNGTVLVQYTE